MIPSRPRRMTVAVLVFGFAIGLTAESHAQSTPDTPAPSPKGLVTQAARDLIGLASVETVWILGAGAGLALAVHPVDDSLNQQLTGSDYRFLGPGKVLGNAWVQGGAAAAMYLPGLAMGRTSAPARIGQELARAQLVAQVVTLGIKVSTRRERPDGSGRLSFPSGHASTSFATATVLAGHLGWKVVVPTFMAATYVATSRLHENRHHISDVVFGAAVGIAAGKTTLRRERGRANIQAVAVPRGALVIVTW